MKKNLPGRGLTKVEKHWFRVFENSVPRSKLRPQRKEIIGE
jgi:hypothetical protein